MQKTNNIATKNYTLTFTKEIGKLWILNGFAPLGKTPVGGLGEQYRQSFLERLSGICLHKEKVMRRS